MSNAKNYTMRFNLTGFLGSRIIDSENSDGIVERGVFIPIDDNDLYVDPITHHVLCEAFVNAKTYNSGDNKSHYIKQKPSKEHAEKLKSLGYKLPYLGSMWYNNWYAPSFQSEKANFGRVKNNQE